MELTEKEQIVLNELKKIMDSMGIDYIPSRSIIKTYNSALISKIDRCGGILTLSKKINIPMGSRVRWNKIKNEDVEEKLKILIKENGLDRFPSRSEMINYFGDMSITNIVSKRGGYKFWADKMGYKMKESETKSGWFGEKIAKELLESKGYIAERLNTNCAYDFVINHRTRVDVKYSKLYKGAHGNFYSFNLEQKFHDCDIYILICERDDKTFKIIVLPQSFVQNQGQISVGEFKSKWYSYIDRFDFIDMYIKFYKEIDYLNLK